MSGDTVPIDWPRSDRRATAPSRARAIGFSVFGVLAIVTALGLIANLLFYKATVANAAASLSDQLARKVALAVHGNNCTAPPPSAPTAPTDPRMLLASAEIGLSAPVLEGTGDKVLNVGVGHVPDSHWPDQGGTSVLAAHNATFFVHLPDLKPGDLITLTAPCRKWTYKVSTQQVVPNTTNVPTSAESKLALVTCWPIDALFNTADRYLLTADLVSTDNNVTQTSPGAVGSRSAPKWEATLPAGLAGSDLSNSTTGVGTGRLTTTGTPSSAWQSSPASLDAVGAAVQLFGGTIQATRTGHPSWWSTLAPGLPVSVLTPLLNAPTQIRFRAPLDLTVTVAGDTLTQVDMTTSLKVGTGTYRLDATAKATGTRLSLSAWKLTLIAGAPPIRASPSSAAPTSITPARITSSTRSSAPANTSAPAKTSAPTPAPKPAPKPVPPPPSPAVADPSLALVRQSNP